MTETWLVTGAAGFIGSNLSSLLLEAGERVVGFDNFATGKKANVERLGAAGGDFTFVEGDIRDSGAVMKAARDARAVVHLAAQVAVQESIRNFAYSDSVNVGGFLNVLSAAGGAEAETFIYASSCAVYGDNPALPLTESELPRPLSPYAVSKLADEHYAGVIGQSLAGTSVAGFRFFNIYGPWQDAGGGYAAVIPKWIECCIEGRRPVMFGDGGATRDFCFVGDVAALIAEMGKRPGAQPLGVYNVGTGTETTLGHLYDTITGALRDKGINLPFDAPEQKPWRDGEIMHSRADITLARDELGFQADVDLAEGIRRMLSEQYGL